MFKDINGSLWKYKIVKIGRVEEGNEYLVPKGRSIITPIIFEHVNLYKQFELIDDFLYKIDRRKNNTIETHVKYGNYISDLKVGYRFTLGKTNIFDSTSDIKYIINNNLFITKNSVYFIYDQSSYRDEQLKKLLD